MKLILSLLMLFILISTSYGQNPDGFDNMAKKMAGEKAPIITKDQVQKLQKANKKIIFLDTREYAEYNVSHMKGATFVGYNKINWDKIQKLDKNATIVVYCSVGFRSGKVTSEMQGLGFTNVKNLYGGLFNWSNNGGKISNSMGVNTNEIHGYNKKWSQWINKDKSQIIL